MTLLLAACGGESAEPDEPIDTGSTSDVPGSDNEPDEPSSEGTLLLVPSPIGGVDLVDLEAESQEQFLDDDLGFVHTLTLDGETLWLVSENDLIRTTVSSKTVEGRITIPDQIADYTVAGDVVLVLTGFAGASEKLVVVDGVGMTIMGTATAPGGTTYKEPVAAGGSYWVMGGDLENSDSLARIDPDTFNQTDLFRTGIIPDSVVTGGGAIWVGGTIGSFDSESGNPETGVSKIDPSTGAVLFRVSLGEPDRQVEVRYAFGALWATNGLDSTLFKLDPATGEILDSADSEDGAAGIPVEIFVTEEVIWMFNPTNRTLEGFDPDTLEFVEGINIPIGAPRPIFAP